MPSEMVPCNECRFWHRIGGETSDGKKMGECRVGRPTATVLMVPRQSPLGQLQMTQERVTSFPVTSDDSSTGCHEGSRVKIFGEPVLDGNVN